MTTVGFKELKLFPLDGVELGYIQNRRRHVVCRAEVHATRKALSEILDIKQRGCIDLPIQFDNGSIKRLCGQSS